MIPRPVELDGSATRKDARTRWWAAFALFAALGACWTLATPLYGAPDEPAHAIRAASVARGELVGEQRPGAPEYYRFVNAPARFAKPSDSAFYDDPRLYVPCFAFRPELTPACFGSLDGPSRLERVATAVGLDPPAFYALSGMPGLLIRSAVGIYLMRMVSVLISAALLASAVVSVGEAAAPRLAASGLALAITPTSLFLIGTVNPNGVEVAAAIAAWASITVLVLQTPERIDWRASARAGIAAGILALVRPLGPLWLTVVVAGALLFATRDRLRQLVRSHPVRVWTVFIAGCTSFQIAWLLTVKPLDSLLRHGEDPGPVGILTIVKRSLGEFSRLYREMIGVFGWLDTLSPAATLMLWTAGLGGLVLASASFASRRWTAVVLGLVGLTVALPVAIDSARARDIGLGWQGRWTLPLAVGVPLMAGLALATTERARQLEWSRLPAVVGVIFVTAHFLAFAQALRRNTVGSFGTLAFWEDPAWTPPLPAAVLLAIYLLACVAFVMFLLRSGPVDPERIPA
jgi:hypothetical protein